MSGRASSAFSSGSSRCSARRSSVRSSGSYRRRSAATTTGSRMRSSAPARAASLHRVPRPVVVRRGHVRAAARARSRARDRRPAAGQRVSGARADRGLDVRPLPRRHARAARQLQRVGAGRLGGAVTRLEPDARGVRVLQQRLGGICAAERGPLAAVARRL